MRHSLETLLQDISSQLSHITQSQREAEAHKYPNGLQPSGNTTQRILHHLFTRHSYQLNDITIE